MTRRSLLYRRFNSFDAGNRRRIIGELHDMIHNGLIFITSTEFTVDAGLSALLLIKTGDVGIHLLPGAKGSLQAKVYFYEGPTVSAEGTPVSSHNRDFTSGKVTGTSFFHTPTVSDKGTVKDKDRFGSGNKSGGESLATNEFVLAANTYYLLEVVSESNGNEVVIKTDHYDPSLVEA